MAPNTIFTAVLGFAAIVVAEIENDGLAVSNSIDVLLEILVSLTLSCNN
jgi:hypothetical protein